MHSRKDAKKRKVRKAPLRICYFMDLSRKNYLHILTFQKIIFYFSLMYSHKNIRNAKFT